MPLTQDVPSHPNEDRDTEAGLLNGVSDDIINPNDGQDPKPNPKDDLTRNELPRLVVKLPGSHLYNMKGKTFQSTSV